MSSHKTYGMERFSIFFNNIFARYFQNLFHYLCEQNENGDVKLPEAKGVSELFKIVLSS